MRKTKLDLLTVDFVQDDCLLIECDVIVIKESLVKETALASNFDIQVPPSDLSDDRRRLLELKEETDVTFEVEGEVFHAHKIVLTMRSPVFKVELYEPKRDTGGMENKTIECMDPVVFEALLHFIYTDSFPVMDDLDHDEKEDMVKHFLVATDRYGMERMKSVCESILCKGFDVESVASTLALAAQHCCISLKDACIEFIISRNRMDVVLANQGYEHPKRVCLAAAVELWEKAAKSIWYNKIIQGELMNCYVS
ncbi:BTB/POZ and MATH domain-containing protein 1-like [Phragmites australis]|uniref:BTB/POZ and MATH domain-containing protein 1-like n=1 Tax=Phragmites australis TaxID=29695 RepID=UPI002D787B16|nr:BTB/POZ and MATH domain-containing protein 1-like [Phragmites australis]